MVKHKYISFENNFISNNNKKMKNESIFIHNNNQVLLKNDKLGFSFKKINIKNNYKSNIFLYYIIIILTILQKIKTDYGYISITLSSLSCTTIPITNSYYYVTTSHYEIKIFFNNNELNDFSNFFKNNYCIKKIDFSNLVYEGVIRAKGMFENCINLKEIDFGSFDASKITDMSRMFYNCTSLTSINFGENFKTSSLTNMEYMFSNCKSLETLDLSIFDTSKVLYMNNLFEDCTRINSLILSSFNTKNVIQMESMFQNCQSLENLELENFYTSSARQIYIINFEIFSINNLFYFFLKNYFQNIYIY